MTGNPRSANGHRRRAIRRRVLAAYNDCAICGQPVDKTLHHLDDWAPEVDEITPVSLGGDPLLWANVQLAHRVCNQRKGNGTRPSKAVANPDAPLTSRKW